jgi:hypothetical protein
MGNFQAVNPTNLGSIILISKGEHPEHRLIQTQLFISCERIIHIDRHMSIEANIWNQLCGIRKL